MFVRFAAGADLERVHLATCLRPKGDHQFDGFHAQSEKFDHLQ